MRHRRLDELLSSLGYCSRREAQAFCDGGRVEALGVRVRRASDRIDAGEVRIDGEALEHPDGLLVALHKPLDFVCSHASSDGRLLYELLPPRWARRTPLVTSIGRLDKDTTGLIMVTDLGPLVHRLTSPKHHVEKTYQVTLDRGVEAAHIEAFSRGLWLDRDDRPTLPATLRVTGPTEAEVTLVEGRYHQVRRMFAACGLHVVALHRTRFGQWTLDGLAAGEWRLEGRSGIQLE